MIVSRRTFGAQLAIALGAATTHTLPRRIEDRAAPLLSPPRAARRTLHVHDGGYVSLGPGRMRGPRRPTSREDADSCFPQIRDQTPNRGDGAGASDSDSELDAARRRRHFGRPCQSDRIFGRSAGDRL